MTKQQHLPSDRLSISHEEINELPLNAFEGKISVISEANKLTRAFHEISEHPVVGFDTETRPSFVKGQQYKVALMQIALPDHVFLIRLQKTGITNEIISFMENHAIGKAGVALRDDVKSLQRLKKFTPNGIIELADMSKNAGLQVESVKKLTGLLLGFRISKSAQTSNWESDTLNEKQISYAATDAWVCLQIYEQLTRLKKK